MNNSQTISFIGGGNMARSLIGGLIADGHDPKSIWVADINPDQRASLTSRLGVNTTASNLEATQQADVLVLAVKPQVMAQAAQEIAAAVQSRQPLVISVAAGIRAQDLDRWLGGNVSLVRTMPNTPALVQTGATALYANARVTAAQRDTAESILRAVGVTLWLDDEGLMDAVTALSGSGPAYFFLVIEAMEQAGRALGLTPEQARLLTLQTALGAAKMALESPEDCATLRARVTSPGGTTERAIAVLEQGGLRPLFEQALTAARDRGAELAAQLGGKT